MGKLHAAGERGEGEGEGESEGGRTKLETEGNGLVVGRSVEARSREPGLESSRVFHDESAP